MILVILFYLFIFSLYPSREKIAIIIRENRLKLSVITYIRSKPYISGPAAKMVRLFSLSPSLFPFPSVQYSIQDMKRIKRIYTVDCTFKLGWAAMGKENSFSALLCVVRACDCVYDFFFCYFSACWFFPPLCSDCWQSFFLKFTRGHGRNAPGNRVRT